jgi:signal transduction histidine kinase
MAASDPVSAVRRSRPRKPGRRIVRALMGPWLGGEIAYDKAALREWLEEARTFRKTLPELIDSYLEARARLERLPSGAGPGGVPDIEWLDAQQAVAVRRAEIYEHLKALGTPTQMYAGQLPLFPTVYHLEVRFADTGEGGRPEPILWNAGLPLGEDEEGVPAAQRQYEEETFPLHGRASVLVRYQLHAYSKRQLIERESRARVFQFGAVVVAGTLLALSWGGYGLWREQERERQRLLDQHQRDQAERLLLVQEKRHEEMERKLLEQKLATQAAERQALELKSQLYASIGIMAGSYAHNIKNLLVRPNDLLRRCIEDDRLPVPASEMLGEVRETLGTVTQRLEQILQTVRRDPTRSEQKMLDLNAIARDLERTWRELAADRWRVDLVVEPGPGPLWVLGDVSHLQQAVENLLFNARDATFEMRNRLRDEARGAHGDEAGRRQAVIEAYAWKGQVRVRTLAEEGHAVLEVIDNGVGMTEEVRRRCVETHFSTKRDNALYEGHSTGMGLGLAFVVTILEHHGAALDITSEPLKGTTFRIRFETADPAAQGKEEG